MQRDLKSRLKERFKELQHIEELRKRENWTDVILNNVDDNKMVICKGSPQVKFYRTNSSYCMELEGEEIQSFGSLITYRKEIGMLYNKYTIKEIKPLSSFSSFRKF